jgi:hypothetical protein
LKPISGDVGFHHQRIDQPILYTRRGSPNANANSISHLLDSGVGSLNRGGIVSGTHSNSGQFEHGQSSRDDSANGNNNLALSGTNIGKGPALSALSDNNKQNGTITNQTAEDATFLRLARDALVATASAANPEGSTLLDPTIEDLLTRLQYASSPHGNPIRKSSSITTNGSGQLNIQDFYKDFPNLSNNIFAGSPKLFEQPTLNNHPSSNSDGWNFLIGENPLKKEFIESSNHSRASYDSHDYSHDDVADDENDGFDDNDFNSKTSSLSDSDRKFLCQSCTQMFRRSSDLKRHEKQHLTIPPSICELCGKGFARKDALKRHKGTLTCKRNANKRLYVDNLNYLKHQQKQN